MLYTNIFYNQYEKDIHSQNGEDGIIEELLKRLEINEGWVCEFGASDGMWASNTFALIERGFKGVYIEGDKNAYNDLLKTVKKYPSIIPLNKYVDHNDTKNSLDNLLSETEIPIDFDVLSIDIDSYDYLVWKNLKKYRPKIVIIEINSGINTDNTTHICAGPNAAGGTSFRPTLNLGTDKGYKFVLHTGNMFFVKNDLFDKLNINYDDELENFRTDWIEGHPSCVTMASPPQTPACVQGTGYSITEII